MKRKECQDFIRRSGSDEKSVANALYLIKVLEDKNLPTSIETVTNATVIKFAFFYKDEPQDKNEIQFFIGEREFLIISWYGGKLLNSKSVSFKPNPRKKLTVEEVYFLNKTVEFHKSVPYPDRF